jgi:hypothetical protein
MKRGPQKRIRTNHGMTGTPTYNTWENMWNRCTQGSAQSRLKKAETYRAITVCERWRDFTKFLEDMGERPPGTTLDRIDNVKGYEPGNCRWATRKEQQRNRSVNNKVMASGVSRCVIEWSETTGVPEATIIHRLNRGVPAEQAVGLVPYQRLPRSPNGTQKYRGYQRKNL